MKINRKIQGPSYSFKDANILVIGGSGAGKSSLINLFYVWSQKWKPADFMHAQGKVLIKTKYLNGEGDSETGAENQAQSQTKKATNYKFRLKDHKKRIIYSLNLLDTPGLGDTKGLRQDDENLKIILNAGIDIKTLNAIFIVMNGSDPRISGRSKYLASKLRGIIPNRLVDNLFILLTNVSLKPNFEIQKLLDYPITQKKYTFWIIQFSA